MIDAAGGTETGRAGRPASGKYLTLLSLGALGVVYGDIGTSPIYAFRESLHPDHEVLPSAPNVLGILSLIFWALVVVISIKYLALVLRADNRGEGGVLALTSLVSPDRERGTGKALLLFGLFGAALMYGDSMITPAISVLSAVEGFEVVTPAFAPYVLPITIAILVLLFSQQSRGTSAVGAVFGPITLVWFLTLGALGVSWVVRAPEVLAAVDPRHAVGFFAANGARAFLVLGSVFLVVTGGEAIYADMGHFGKRPIRLAWFGVVLPCLLLNYFGQGALVLRDPSMAANPFFLMAPRWALVPLVLLTAVATVIASQAVISGAFSLTMQAVQLGYLPRVTIEHTSSRERGQIYVPIVNWGLMVACVALVLTFRTSSDLAAAYGVAVTTTMVVTTSLLFFAARDRWGWSVPVALMVSAVLLTVDLGFWGANLHKIPEGGWLPLAVAAVVMATMTTWRRGRELVVGRTAGNLIPSEFFVADLQESPPQRVPGTAVFMHRSRTGTPPALINSLQHFGVLHERVVFLRVETLDIPFVAEGERSRIERIAEGTWRVAIRYGFMEEPDVPRHLTEAGGEELHLDPERTTYFVGKETLIASSERVGMALWRERLFAFLTRNARDATSFFRLPAERVVEMGARVEI